MGVRSRVGGYPFGASMMVDWEMAVGPGGAHVAPLGLLAGAIEACASSYIISPRWGWGWCVETHPTKLRLQLHHFAPLGLGMVRRDAPYRFHQSLGNFLNGYVGDG